MIKRDVSPIIEKMAKIHPALTIAGPRHAGKTTLARKLFPQHRYVNLEDPDTRDFARRHPDEFFKRHRGHLLLDEFRLAPELMPHIRAITARGGRWPGRLILVTSHRQPARPGIMLPPVREPATFVLLPLSIGELTNAEYNLGRDQYIARGFMPRAYDSKTTAPENMYGDIYAQYIERDVRRLINLDNPDAFERFLKMLAGRVGQIINLNALAKNAGVSQTTLTTWITVLEASFVVFRLQPYFDNFGKRIVKRPKLYFTDVGFAAYLLGIKDFGQLAREPSVGNLFENMVVTEALKCIYNSGKKSGLYYFRNQNCIEVDLLLRRGGKITPMEIKCGTEPDSSFARNIMLFRKLSAHIENGYIVYSGENCVKKGKKELPAFLNFKEIGGIIGKN